MKRQEDDVPLRAPSVPLVLALTAGAWLGLGRPAQAQTVKVHVTVETIEALDCVDEITGPNGNEIACRSDADLYAAVRIADEDFSQCGPRGYACPAAENFDSNLVTTSWDVFKEVDLSRLTVPVRIQVWDDDDRIGDAWPDDHVDLDGDDGSRDLDLIIDLAACIATPGAGTTGVSGDVSGGCGASLSSQGTANDRAKIRFHIDVSPPPATANLNVLCSHVPVWPQPGDTVTFTANARDGTLQGLAATTVEVWVDDRAAPRATCPAAARCSTALTAGSPTLAYGCRVINTTAAGTETVWTGWRVVDVGAPPNARAVSIGSTGPQGTRIDVVFVPEKDDYTGASDPNFLSDVGAVVRGSYYNDLFYLTHQDQMSFWLAMDRAEARGYDGVRCKLTPPDDWDDTYAFADVGGVVHRRCFRDCARSAQERIFSAPVNIKDFDGNGDGDCADVGDTDVDGNGTCEVDVDANGDGDCSDPGDTDFNANGVCDRDIDSNGNGVCSDAPPPGDTDLNGDGVCQVDVDANGDGDCADAGDTDFDGNGACDADVDVNGDGDCADRADRDCNGNGSCDSCDASCLGRPRVFLHETGHVPFGLADEYCCDGGYFQADPFPNLYDEKAPEFGAASPTCRQDAGSLGRNVNDCVGFTGQHLPPFRDFDWFRSDPPKDDLMKDNGTPRGADIRRIDYVFDRCRAGKC